MPGKKLASLTAAVVPLFLHAAPAQELAADGGSVVVVEGLAKDDLLNVRATASPTGMVIGRLANGSTLRTQSCDEVNGYKWCNVVALDDETLHGWTPARYLHAASGESLPVAKTPTVQAQGDETIAPQVEAAPTAAGSADAAPPPAQPATQPIRSAPDPKPEKVVATADQAGNARETAASAAAPEAGPGVDGGSPLPAPADLAARLGGGSGAMLAYGGKGTPVVESDVIASAFRMAFAGTGMPPTGELYTLGAKNGEQPPPSPPAAPPTVTAETSRSPRTLPSPSGADTSPRVAQLQTNAIAPAYDVVGEVPCARYIGQPMTRCEAMVARTGADAADVTVTLPDGGKRVIHFRDGKPESSNSRGEFRFTREGDLSMIRVGTSERFEILDSLAFGD